MTSRLRRMGCLIWYKDDVTLAISLLGRKAERVLSGQSGAGLIRPIAHGRLWLEEIVSGRSEIFHHAFDISVIKCLLKASCRVQTIFGSIPLGPANPRDSSNLNGYPSSRKVGTLGNIARRCLLHT